MPSEYYYTAGYLKRLSSYEGPGQLPHTVEMRRASQVNGPIPQALKDSGVKIRGEEVETQGAKHVVLKDLVYVGGEPDAIRELTGFTEQEAWEAPEPPFPHEPGPQTAIDILQVTARLRREGVMGPGKTDVRVSFPPPQAKELVGAHPARR